MLRLRRQKEEEEEFQMMVFYPFLSLSLIPRKLLVFRVLETGIEDWGSSGDGGGAEVLLARVARLPAGSVSDLDSSRFPC